MSTRKRSETSNNLSVINCRRRNRRHQPYGARPGNLALRPRAESFSSRPSSSVRHHALYSQQEVPQDMQMYENTNTSGGTSETRWERHLNQTYSDVAHLASPPSSTSLDIITNNNIYCKHCNDKNHIHNPDNCPAMKIIGCNYAGCKWIGRKMDYSYHENNCPYAHASGEELLQILKNTRMSSTADNYDNLSENKLPIDHLGESVLPLFESSKLAAIDFELKDIQQSLRSAMSSSNSLENCETLLRLTELLILNQSKEQFIIPSGSPLTWVIYESGTASALGETISVKMMANIDPVNCTIFLTYSINFHDKLHASFKFAHLLLDGSADQAVGIMPIPRKYDIKESTVRVEKEKLSGIIVSTKPCRIEVQQPIMLYQMILGQRKVSFRLFLFDSPPEELYKSMTC